MAEWVVPLIVGVSASLATVVVGFLTYRQSRRDVRDNLKRDIELYKSMPDDWSQARIRMAWYVEERVSRLAIEEVASREFRLLLVAVVAIQPFAVWVMFRRLDEGLWAGLWRGVVTVVAGVTFAFFLRRAHTSFMKIRVKQVNRSFAASRQRAVSAENAERGGSNEQSSPEHAGMPRTE